MHTAPRKPYKQMPGFEGMGKGQKVVLAVIVAVIAIVGIGAMLKGMDSAHGAKTAEVAPH